MSEYWARSSELGNNNYIHQLGQAQLASHDGIRNAAAAARAYGRKIVQAEAYTIIRRQIFPNWDKAPFNFKDLGDRAFCAGLNRNVLNFWVLQPEEQSKPGYAWPGVGGEFDRHVTWWPMGQAWLTYLARCQSLLQAGDFVSDVAYFEGEWIPNFVPAKWAMNPALPAGFDCTSVNAETLATRVRVAEDGRLVLNDSMTFRYLVLPQGGRWSNPGRARPQSGAAQTKGKAARIPVPAAAPAAKAISLAVSPTTLQRIEELVEAGATLVGPPAARAIGLTDYPASDQAVRQLAATLWGSAPGAAGELKIGKGRVIWGKKLKEIFKSDGLAPDLEIKEDSATANLAEATLSGIPNPGGSSFDWIHRRIEGAEVWFIANLRNACAGGDFTFRAAGLPELWDAVTGQVRSLPQFNALETGRTVVPLQFTPRQSFFIVFPARANDPSALPMPNAEFRTQQENFPELEQMMDIGGPWEVSFDPQWGGPETVTFEKLEDWTRRPEEGIKYYSGTATYRKHFDLPHSVPKKGQVLRAPGKYLDLGEVKNIARVRLNGHDLGVVWTAPWRVEITGVAKERDNALEIEVINLWPNRLIGDVKLPPGQRLTKSNVPPQFIKPDTALFPSGLLGPVTIQGENETESEEPTSRQ
jgi:hypothetical protein